MVRAKVAALWKKLVVDVRDDIEDESARYRAETPPEVGIRKVAIVLICVGLTVFVLNYFGKSGTSQWLSSVLDFLGADDLADRFDRAMNQGESARFNRRVFWSVARLIAYVLVPLLLIRFVLRDRISDYGVRVRGTLRYWPVYAVLLAGIAPAVYFASLGGSFQAKYPFYRLAAGESLWPYFILWEILYALQFVSLEFFYRGFMLHGLRRWLGFSAIYVMVVPYCMIHFTKPAPEALGAILAGFILGVLSLKSRSIWWGALVHISVAWSMDLLALWHRGLLW